VALGSFLPTIMMWQLGKLKEDVSAKGKQRN